MTTLLWGVALVFTVIPAAALIVVIVRAYRNQVGPLSVMSLGIGLVFVTIFGAWIAPEVSYRLSWLTFDAAIWRSERGYEGSPTIRERMARDIHGRDHLLDGTITPEQLGPSDPLANELADQVLAVYLIGGWPLDRQRRTWLLLGGDSDASPSNTAIGRVP